ncbi:hypothetical protein [Sutcliffiella rhizosphaerae]|uniref:DNA-directed RNA polymerase subunit beta n=1 Tax=Sutcliffiella rhizosphaerae TaxID=2880967 RepID=A0ABM8YP69_9BACI|nr:hypothetical protein [Sutcliffiella rhizosphaerae]CAG9621601.1 hypothetical protein BACCIP111883_02374 [Sutcliffiella rhizosphaerae]
MKTESRKSLETYALLIVLVGLFLGSILLASVLSNNSFFAMIPEFSWDMVNDWNDIFNK